MTRPLQIALGASWRVVGEPSEVVVRTAPGSVVRLGSALKAIRAKWKQATQEVCAVAYAPYRQGTIYPQMVVGCDDRLNRVLLEELKGPGN